MRINLPLLLGGVSLIGVAMILTLKKRKQEDLTYWSSDLVSGVNLVCTDTECYIKWTGET